jgi:hypothetical protein
MLEESQPEELPESAPPAVTPSLDFPGAAALTEDLVLAQLKNRDLPADDVERISQNAALMKSRKVRLALASHPHCPRRVALRLIREFFNFELMHFALMPTVAADLKRVADEQLVTRLASIGLGERISLARRSSQMVAGALLLDKETQVWKPALENPRLTETPIVKALQRGATSPAFVEAVSHHSKWSYRLEIRAALLRNAHTPLARVIEFARRIPPAQLRDILHTSRLPETIKDYLRKTLDGERRMKSG